jgi:hypothetical protein
LGSFYLLKRYVGLGSVVARISASRDKRYIQRTRREQFFFGIFL